MMNYHPVQQSLKNLGLESWPCDFIVYSSFSKCFKRVVQYIYCTTMQFVYRVSIEFIIIITRRGSSRVTKMLFSLSFHSFTINTMIGKTK